MRRFWSAALAGTLLLFGLGTLLMRNPAAARGKRGVSQIAGDQKTPAGLSFRLGEGTEHLLAGNQAPLQPTATERVQPAPATALTPEQAERVLARLQPLETDGRDRPDFALREDSLPAPRTGVTLAQPFPPLAPSTPTEPGPSDGPLRLLRHAPEGDVALAPQLSLTFSAPMVAVTSHAEARARPAQIDPAPPGRWRWVGTRTLLFEPEGRFPMATAYTVRVPRGTRATAGDALQEGTQWTFRTPPPGLATSYPRDTTARPDTLFFAAFDQRIDPRAMLRSVRVRTGGRTHRVRLAEPDELEQDDAVKQLIENSQNGRWLAFRTHTPLPSNSAITVTIEPGAPSAEGPRRTTEAQRWTFRTFGPLEIKEHSCGGRRDCRPGMPWQVRFSNPLNRKVFSKDQITIQAPLARFKTEIWNDRLVLRGPSKGRTRYRVTLDAGIEDIFGQTLGRAETLVFDVGPAVTRLSWSGDPLVVLDPATSPTLPVYTVNYETLKLRAYAVQPADWPAYLEFMRGPTRNRPETRPPGRLVLETDVPIADMPEELVETRLALSSLFPDSLGHAVVAVEAHPRPSDRRHVDSFQTWVQSTRIGLSGFVDDKQMLVFASSLADGRPLPELELALGNQHGRTDADGLARLTLDASLPRTLVAHQGNDVAFLVDSPYAWNRGSWTRRRAADRLLFYVIDDRGLYRPGETARLKGWVRSLKGGMRGELALLSRAQRRLRYTLRDSRGNEVRSGETQLNLLGGFELKIELPATMNLGTAVLLLENPAIKKKGGGKHRHVLRVEEFRRPEFEVSARASEGPHLVGGAADVTTKAAYYAGDALAAAEVAWAVSTRPARFSPPGRDDFTFGTWVPWWRVHHRPERPTRHETYAARTDAGGHHVLRVAFESVDPPEPTSLTAEATVTDVNRQAFSATAHLLVHPASLYVGLRSARLFVQQGEPLEVETIVADIDGGTVGERQVEVRAERLDWQQDGDSWKEVPTLIDTCNVTSKDEPQTCRFVPSEGGAYRITATVEDDQQRANRSQLRLWVAGGARPPRARLEQEEVQLIPARRDYQPGETAEILVLSPFPGAEGVLTLRRAGLLRAERFRMQGSSHTLRIPVDEAWTPNVHVQINLTGSAPRTDAAGRAHRELPARPAFARGSLDLRVAPHQRTLKLAVQPREAELEPGGSTTIDVSLQDADGRPVQGGEVAVVVADEAVLALSGYQLRDPVAAFYPSRSTGVRDHHTRSHVLLAQLGELEVEEEDQLARRGDGTMAFEAMPAAAPVPGRARPKARMALGAREQQAPTEPIRTRVDFAALALFAGSLTTDARGQAHVSLKLPDNLTRYRIMAVAASGPRRFGKAESVVTARLPLMVRPSPPRFLNFGDRFELSVVVQNQTDQPFQVDVALRSSLVRLVAGNGRRVDVPARDRVEVRFPAEAVAAGTARFQVGAAAGRWVDAAEFKLPVWTPATTEAFATYGQLDEGALVQPVAAPRDVIPGYGGLEVTTSSTALQALTDAVLYLVRYPFECSEQLASRVLGIAALRNVLTAFEAEGLPDAKELAAAVARDLEQLAALQNDDGGFAFWRRGDRSWPYLSVHVAHALARAQSKDFEVPATALERSHGYLRNVEQHIPKVYGPQARHTLIAYALYVRQRLNDPDPARARRLLQETGLEKLSFEALGWLLPVLSGDAGSQAETAGILRHLHNNVAETAAAAHFAVSYGEQAHLLLHSNRRADAVLLEALIEAEPASDLIPKLVSGLLGHRKAGRWNNTQENVFVLLALDRYFNTYEKQTPDFVARLWLGKGFAGEQVFRGRETARRRIAVPMPWLMEHAQEPTPLLLSKQGPGRLYYRIGMRYAPSSLRLSPAEHGFAVERRYEAVDDPEDVRRDEEGHWHIRAGARVRVRVSLAAPGRRTHVALVDPLPAGFEALNPALATTGALPLDAPDQVTVMGARGLGGPGRGRMSYWFWHRPWFEHQNLRDDRAEAFTSLLWAGVYSYTYVARATTPGVFVVPPPKAEEMYHPETFGRGATAIVTIR